MKVEQVRSPGQQAFVDHLRSQFVGPKGGDYEVIESNPVYAYLTGMLFPVEDGEGLAPETLDEDLSPEEADLDQESDAIFPGEDDEHEDDIGNLTAASGWTPSSLGLSFIHDAPELSVTARAARYERVLVEGGAPSAGADGKWQRVPLATSRSSSHQARMASRSYGAGSDAFNGALGRDEPTRS